MSDKKDKPADFDPDATVMQSAPRPAEAPGHDPDATVMMGSRKDLVAPDEDATVMMRPGALGGGDEDATVMMPAGLGKGEPPAEAPKRMPMAAFQRDDDPDATVIGAPPPEPEPEPAPATAASAPVVVPVVPVAPAPERSTPVTADTSRMPLIAGGLVVVAVALYFVLGGGKPPPPAEQKPEAPAAAAPAPAAPAAPSKAPGVKDLLAAQVKSGSIAIAEEGGVTTITLTSVNQFASGGVDIEAKLAGSVLAIAVALDKVSGSIVVTGYADAKPSSNAKFPSNQALSAARGESVARLIAGKLRDPKRVKGEGAGDSQQVAPSDTAEKRAKNRRVVIVLRPAQ